MTLRRHASPAARRPAARVAALLAGALLAGGLLTTGLVAAGCAARDRTVPAPGTASASSPAPVPLFGGDVVTQGDPVTVFELADPVVRYQYRVAEGLAQLEGQLRALVADVQAGDVATARADWLAAHLTYHRLGAAYGAFGETGERIDRLAAGLSGGTGDPGFTGFHRVERVLWSGTEISAAVAPATSLLADVRSLRAAARKGEESGEGALDIPANEVTLRAHEILEDTLQFQLTGKDDYGSGTSLDAARADVAGTRVVVTLLRPVLDRHAPGQASRIETALDDVDTALTSALAGARPQGGTGPVPVRALPLPVRQRLDAAVGRALEALAPVPGLLAVEEDDD